MTATATMRPLVDYLLVRATSPDAGADLLRAWSSHRDFATVDGGPGLWVRAAAPLPLSTPLEHHDEHRWCGAPEGAERVGSLVALADDLDEAARRPSAAHRLARHPGDVGAVVLRERSATVMRSPAGLVPWYVHRRSDGLLAISTRLAWFRRHVPGTFPTDPLAMVLAADGISSIDGRTPLAGVEFVPVGRMAHVTADGRMTSQRHWDPERATPDVGRRDDGPERGARLRSILIERLEADLDPGGANLLGLSGGVDSSCLGALAVGPAGRSTDAFTFLPPADHRSFERVDRYVRSIVEVVRPNHHWRIPIDEEEGLRMPFLAPAVDLPIPHPALASLPAIVAEGRHAVYCGGEAADDLFAGPFVLGKDWIENIPLRQLLLSLRRPWYGVGRRFVASEWLAARRGRRRPPLPVATEPSPLLTSDLTDGYRDWIADLERRVDGSRHPYRHLLLFLEFDGWLRQNWEACSELNVRRSLPFWCRETIELALSTPPRRHALPAKRLIRLGLEDDVPAANLHRPDKGTWSERQLVAWPFDPPTHHLADIIQPGWGEKRHDPVPLDEAAFVAVLLASTRT